MPYDSEMGESSMPPMISSFLFNDDMSPVAAKNSPFTQPLLSGTN